MRSRQAPKTRMMRVLIATIIVLMATLVISAGAPAADSGLSVDAVLKQVDRQAKTFESLSANVERTKVTVVVDDHSVESGQMQVRRDDKMRIELTSPDPRTILRDGDHLFVYTPRAHQVEEYDLSKHRDLVDQFLLLGFGTSAESLK